MNVSNLQGSESTQVTLDYIEPSIWTVSNEKGIYEITASHVFRGLNSIFGPNNIVINSNKGWISRTKISNYNENGIYIGDITTPTQTQTINGEYIQIKFPFSFVLSSYSILNSNVNSFFILGSNDGVTFEFIDSHLKYFDTNSIQPLTLTYNINSIQPLTLTYNITPIQSTLHSSISYSIYRLIISETTPINNGPYGVYINSWNLFN